MNSPRTRLRDEFVATALTVQQHLRACDQCREAWTLDLGARRPDDLLAAMCARGARFEQSRAVAEDDWAAAGGRVILALLRQRDVGDVWEAGHIPCDTSLFEDRLRRAPQADGSILSTLPPRR